MSEPELRKELAEERRELQDAVASLRTELGNAADRGKKLGTMVGAAAGAAIAMRLLFRLLRRR